MPSPKTKQEPIDKFSEAMFQRRQQSDEQKYIEATKEMKARNDAMKHERQTSAEVNEARRKVEEDIKKMIDGRSEAFVEWATGMNSIVSYLRTFNEYLYLSMGNDAMPNISWDKSNSDSLNISRDGKAQPDISYSVTMDDTGHIKTGVTADKNIITPEEKKYFDAALSAWAHDNDYTLQVDRANPDAGFTLKNNTTGQLVTDKAVFDNLKKDPTNGLHRYLTDRFAMTLEEKSTPIVAGP
ncbi:hypothetical protein [Legionella clemsonensis]|uniref:Uncharacterized protein n=1 Tax=Legionella clemsonensis TaxID=1867846 RepID=A0A222P2G5_9GAMM|nr:hypothetical protein [Legionella clemsonensis]ASQ45955.1 hypothetical protein clem_07000 [Legionella clemsonensis]